MIYKITEIFCSICGEGLLQGIPVIFIRFSGCNLKCSFCDTKYAWAQGKEFKEDEILKRVEKFNYKRVCFTGGEPYLQEILYLFKFFKKKNFWVSVETNGTIWKDIKFDWITVSPKKEGRKYHKYGYDERFIKVANEFKYVITEKDDLNFIDKRIKKPIILQPVNNSKKISRIIVKFLKENPKENWYLRIQMHKIINIK
ncbi:MAG: 7-carboxy-7-deazaguanine synthase QueE [Candidatus Omnitrophica bacterium]|nr:7-carboxy-7-deazaguanine synthase QueE [Candidatus Omnitrophota bacterium]